MVYKARRNLGLIFLPYTVPYESLYFCIIKFAKKTRTNMREQWFVILITYGTYRVSNA